MRWHGGKAIPIRVYRCLAVLAAWLSGLSAASAAEAAPSFLVGELSAAQIVLFSALIGAVTFAVVSAIALIRARNRAETENVALKLQLAASKAAAERAEALVDDEDQRVVAWGPPSEPALVAGKLAGSSGAPADRGAFLAFGTWLKPESAGRLDRAVERLRDRGEPFGFTLATSAGRLLDVNGRTVGGLAVARFRDLTGDRLVRAEIEAHHELLLAEVDAMRAMLASAPMPIWLRDGKGRLVWVNEAYAAAVEADSPAAAVEKNLELLDSAVRDMIAAAHRAETPFEKRVPAIVSGNRRVFDVADIASAAGSAGIAADVTEIDAADAALRREIAFNARTLDQLATAVAIFGPDRRLKSYNAAYRSLFGLSPAFLDSMPEENAVLDRLRVERKLPEQADFRSWREELLSAYRALEAREHWWYLPDGQTLRVIANPNPQGGMTWVYENVTARLDLESRYNALIQVQGETLDSLTEGVAVFGSDGRLRLHNPAFAAIFGLAPALFADKPHVADIVKACRRAGDDDAMWAKFSATVAGLDDGRSPVSGRMERGGGRVIDYATVPLPDGQIMATFVDVTDSAKVERALVDRNEALEAAASIKNAFIHHVSYELRSPLTNIIGFAQLLEDARVGPLNDKQREYMGYIMASSAALLAIVNDILDLATIDAGIMELDLAEVDIAEVVTAAIDGVRDRLGEAQVRVETSIDGAADSFVADPRRVRQILLNLLVNAVAFSRPGGRITVGARRDGDMIEFTVEDEGSGIPTSFIGSVFDRFTSQPQGGARGGAGLGLAIVKSFVGLHGGTVEIASEEGKGSTVKVRLPVRPAVAAAAAE